MNSLLALSIASTLSTGQIWSHEGQPAQVVELFTSEGCSSCPPADRFLSELEHHPHLWKHVIPIAYHVDYWDYLGWHDDFAKAEFSQLQRLYRAYDVVDSVYTPGFVVDGKEWRGFFNWVNRTLPKQHSPEATRLILSRKGNQFSLNFDRAAQLDATIIFLVNNKTTLVKAGENKNKALEHDFIAVERQQRRSSEGVWQFDLRHPLSDVDAVVAWVTAPGSFERIQTVAGQIE
ncbi:DUF1223 domain-containing protein [Vibrio ostreicida]|uniref:DUF1223 domain-containing protein n=1 Tax=Vibrio ostreicida TaxID=526588 RepID=A0ABT8BY77_9VIBR|nr:DUF1223 domain-containing protein [Vibrio ostreicida]MDN3611608.1 DUF1223 domain-containing protein [Vibrio ostreicida]NPD09099.1 DUF1223 domain-containing protein [Vibrio ostreicida]